jgi:hypothetical protein
MPQDLQSNSRVLSGRGCVWHARPNSHHTPSTCRLRRAVPEQTRDRALRRPCPAQGRFVEIVASWTQGLGQAQYVQKNARTRRSRRISADIQPDDRQRRARDLHLPKPSRFERNGRVDGYSSPASPKSRRAWSRCTQRFGKVARSTRLRKGRQRKLPQVEEQSACRTPSAKPAPKEAHRIFMAEIRY